MTTAADLINETRRHILMGHRDELNTLNGAVSSGATTLVFSDDLAGIKTRARLGIELETYYVRTTTESTKTATVFAAQEGSTAAAHSSGALVRVNPKVTDHEIFDVLNAELDDLSSPANGLFQVKTLTLTYSANVEGYDLTAVTDLIDVLEVRYSLPGSSKEWPEIRPGDYRLSRNMATTEFASGFALFLAHGGYPGRSVRIRYKAPFTNLATTADDVLAVAGLPATAHDIPALGAAARLMLATENKRNFTELQGDSRRAEEVPPGARSRGAQGLLALRAQRILSESARLMVQYPSRRAI